MTTFIYDDYGALTNETVIGVAGTNVIERFYDEYGRNAGYALNGIRQTALGYDPATGRLVSMSVPTGEEESNHSTPTPPTYTYFTWTYHLGTDLKSQLTYPNGMTATWTYDANSQLLQVRNVFCYNNPGQYVDTLGENPYVIYAGCRCFTPGRGTKVQPGGRARSNPVSPSNGWWRALT